MIKTIGARFDVQRKGAIPYSQGFAPDGACQGWASAHERVNESKPEQGGDGLSGRCDGRAQEAVSR